MSKIERLRVDVEEHGEVHATVAEIDGEVEMRKGVTTFDEDDGLVTVEGADTVHHFDAGDIVHWYRPMDVFHD